MDGTTEPTTNSQISPPASREELPAKTNRVQTANASSCLLAAVIHQRVLDLSPAGRCAPGGPWSSLDAKACPEFCLRCIQATESPSNLIRAAASVVPPIGQPAQAGQAVNAGTIPGPKHRVKSRVHGGRHSSAPSLPFLRFRAGDAAVFANRPCRRTLFRARLT